MHHIFYLFRVPRKNVDRFLQISADAGAIYRQHGAVASAVMRLTDGAKTYGCLGLTDQIRATADEQFFLGIDSFENVEDFHAVTTRIDSDTRINQLYKEIQTILDLGKVIRWEAEEVD